MVGVIGQLAAYDHWRQRVTLIENVLVEPGLSDDELDARYDAAAVRLEQLAADGARPTDEPLVEPPDLEEALPEVRSTFGGDAYCRAVEVIKEHLLAGAVFKAVLSPRVALDPAETHFNGYRLRGQNKP